MKRNMLVKVFIALTILIMGADLLLNTAIPLSSGEIMYSILTGILGSLSLTCMIAVIVYISNKVTHNKE